MRAHTLIRIDTRTIADCQGEIRAFMTVRNEILRLPQTLAHYRKLGVGRFFVIDNGSTDGTKELLTAQPDCHVFLTRNSYSEARLGVEWQHALLDEYGVDHWCLVVDADEWFIYPGYEDRSLPELAAYLQQSGAQGMFAFLLDMYGWGGVAGVIPRPEHSLLDACRYFDTQYIWDYGFRALIHLTRQQFPPSKVIGGPRWLPLPVVLRPAPNLKKIPFVQWLPGTRYANPHATTPIKLADVTGVLMHFKFLEDFSARVNIEVGRKEHWQGASEYRRYLAKLRHEPGLSFHYNGSVAYEDSQQLLRLGLMREDDAWMRIRTASSRHRACVSAAPGMRSRDIA
jgi:glycosyltransferase involved in cell wall biosynthesis